MAIELVARVYHTILRWPFDPAKIIYGFGGPPGLQICSCGSIALTQTCDSLSSFFGGHIIKKPQIDSSA